MIFPIVTLQLHDIDDFFMTFGLLIVKIIREQGRRDVNLSRLIEHDCIRLVNQLPSLPHELLGRKLQNQLYVPTTT